MNRSVCGTPTYDDGDRALGFDSDRLSATGRLVRTTNDPRMTKQAKSIDRVLHLNSKWGRCLDRLRVGARAVSQDLIIGATCEASGAIGR